MPQSKLDHLILQELTLYKEGQTLMLKENDVFTVRNVALLVGLLAGGVLGRKGVLAFLKRSARSSAKQLKHLKAAQNSVRSLSTGTANSLKAEVNALSNSSSKFYRDVDDFVEGAGNIISRGKIDASKFQTLRARMSSNVDSMVTNNNQLRDKIESTIRSATSADKSALKSTLKQVKNQNKELETLRNSINNSRDGEGLASVLLGASRRYGGVAERFAMAGKYGGKTRYGLRIAGKGFKGAGVAGLTAFKYLLNPITWIVIGGSGISAYVWDNWLRSFLTSEQALRYYKQLSGDLVENAELTVDLIMAYINGEDVRQAIEGGEQVLNQDRFKKLMTGSNEENFSERVTYMKSIMANLIALKILPRYAQKQGYPTYEKSLATVRAFFSTFKRGGEGGAMNELVAENAIAATEKALIDIKKGSFSFVKLLNLIEERGENKLVPSGLDSMEYLYQAYLFAAIKQKYPSAVVDQEGIFKSQASKDKALMDLVESLEAANATPGIVNLVKKIRDGKVTVRKSPKLKNFIIRKYFTGGEAEKVNGIKNRAADVVARDLIKSF